MKKSKELRSVCDEMANSDIYTMRANKFQTSGRMGDLVLK